MALAQRLAELAARPWWRRTLLGEVPAEVLAFIERRTMELERS